MNIMNGGIFLRTRLSSIESQPKKVVVVVVVIGFFAVVFLLLLLLLLGVLL